MEELEKRYYQLKSPWQLCRYLLEDYFLIDRSITSGAPLIKQIPFIGRLLWQCDGKTPLEDNLFLLSLTTQGVLTMSSEPIPETDPTARRDFSFRRRYMAQIGITGRCNLNCKHCFMASDSGHKQNEIPLKNLEKLIADLADLHVEELEITGGEPLLHPDFWGVMDSVKASGIKLTRVLTNGYLLTHEMFEEFRSRDLKPEIVISFDGLGFHSWLRNSKDAEESALQAIRLTVAEGFPLRCTINVNQMNRDVILDTCRFLAKEGASSFFLIRTSEVPRWLEHAENSFLSMEDYHRTGLELAAACLEEQWGVEIQVFNAFQLPKNGPYDQVMKSLDFRQIDPDDYLVQCIRAGHGVFIAHDGRVLPCDAYEGMTMITGKLCSDNSIYSRPLEDIMSNSSLAQLSNTKVSDYQEKHPECTDCKWVARCRGGCRAFAYGWAAAANKTDFKNAPCDFCDKSPSNCTFYKGGFADQLQALLMRYI